MSGLTRSSANWKTSSGRSAVMNAWTISRAAMSSRSPTSPSGARKGGDVVVDIVVVTFTETRWRAHARIAVGFRPTGLPALRHRQRPNLHAMDQHCRWRGEDRRDGFGDVARAERPARVVAVGEAGRDRARVHHRDLHPGVAQLE